MVWINNSDFAAYMYFCHPFLFVFLQLILVIYFCCNKSPKNSGLKKTKLYYLQFYRLEVWCASHWTKIKFSAGMHSFLDVLGEELLFHSFQILKVAHLPLLLVPLSHLQSQQCSISLTHLMCSHLPLTIDRKGYPLLRIHSIRMG